MYKTKGRYLYILLLSLYSFFNILLIEGDRLFVFDLNWAYLFAIILINVTLIWEGNRLIAQNLKLLSVPLIQKIHPLIRIFIFSLLNVTLISFLSVGLILILLGQPISNLLINFKLSLGFSFRVNLFLNCVNAIVYFMNELSDAKLRTEKLQKENVEAQFQALRNQVNPHFLFNSLNVLSNLVTKEPQLATDFIQELSKVYRYLLYYQSQKVVKLKDELEFINSYIFLLKIRFKDNLLIKSDIEEKFKEYFLPPATLQLLTENAIKHNIISKKQPLTINFKSNGEDVIIIENNLQLKNVKEASTSVGLKNIRDRYRFISDEEVDVRKDGEKFIVKVPLIKIPNS
ncbi:sensor histidine kinase [Flexithrix dorotheae]|uniref:sensor histidine kinase n=1 Tax=Flexithrix dorotheae TaxID=70993 RepID=UPI0004764018|nr:histidine kinase [Flexithrix dorotheae]